MKINIILPFLDKTGGIAVALEHARHLTLRGHDVAVYCPIIPYYEYWYSAKPIPKKWLGYLKGCLRNLIFYRNRAPWYHEVQAVKLVPVVSNRTVRDADASMATAFPTAMSVNALAPSKGRKYYFVQGHEQWMVDREIVDKTYALPLGIITIAPHLTELMKSRFRRDVRAEVHNGIDLDFFRPPAAKKWGAFRILMLHHFNVVKGTEFGLKALEAIHARFPHVRISLFGHLPFPDCPGYIEFHQDPAPQSLVRLYQESQIFLSPSVLEGWHLPPMEAMACQCAVVATRVGCIPTLDEGDNMMTVEPRDSAAIAEKIAYLLEHADECRNMALRGHETILQYSWGKAAAALEEALSG